MALGHVATPVHVICFLLHFSIKCCVIEHVTISFFLGLLVPLPVGVIEHGYFLQFWYWLGRFSRTVIDVVYEYHAFQHWSQTSSKGTQHLKADSQEPLRMVYLWLIVYLSWSIILCSPWMMTLFGGRNLHISCMLEAWRCPQMTLRNLVLPSSLMRFRLCTLKLQWCLFWQ